VDKVLPHEEPATSNCRKTPPGYCSDEIIQEGAGSAVIRIDKLFIRVEVVERAPLSWPPVWP
jgi:hypothetical protein